MPVSVKKIGFRDSELVYSEANGEVVLLSYKDTNVLQCNPIGQIRERRGSTIGAIENRGRTRCGEDISFRHVHMHS